MATNIPDWMNESWHMATINASSFANKIVTFDTSSYPSGPIKVVLQGQTSPAWGTLDSSSVAAAASSEDALTTVTGVAGGPNAGQPFHIDHTDGVLKCYLDPSPQHRWIHTILGVAAGTLLGGAAGAVADSLRVGALAGLIGATTGLLVMFRAVKSGAIHLFGKGPYFAQGGGPTPTWVANDGGQAAMLRAVPQAVSMKATA